MARWSIVLSLSLVMAAGIAAPQSASACPTQPTAGRQARVVRGGSSSRNARVAPPAADVPAPSAAGAERYNLARVNAFRGAAGLAPVSLDAALTSFARAGSAQLMKDHTP